MAKVEGISREWLAVAIHNAFLAGNQDRQSQRTSPWEDLRPTQRQEYRRTACVLAPMIENLLWSEPVILAMEAVEAAGRREETADG